MPSEKRITIPLKLHRERDADLIGWYKNLPSGTHEQRGGKGELLVSLLRSIVFDLPLDTDAYPASPTPAPDNGRVMELERDNAELRQVIDSLRQQNALLQDAIGQLRQHEHDLHALNSRMQALEQGTPIAPGATVEAVEKISKKEKAERAGRMLKNDW